MIRVVGGLTTFTAFGMWLAGQGVYVAPIQHVYPSKPKYKSVRVKYVWQKAPDGQYPASGRITFDVGTQRHYLFNLAPDAIDIWGVKSKNGLTETRVLNLEIVP